MRFSELQRAIPQATAKMLIQQLREMEDDELVSRKVYPVVPPKTAHPAAQLSSQADRPCGKFAAVVLNGAAHAFFERYFALPAERPDERHVA